VAAAGEVTVENEYAALLQGLGPDSIVQADRSYETETLYKITFRPENRVDAAATTIFFTFPSSVKVGTLKEECKCTNKKCTNPGGKLFVGLEKCPTRPESDDGTYPYCYVKCGEATSDPRKCTRPKLNSR